jgi:RNA polymerase sigma-70 factor (ECF subfamily)
MTDALTVPEVLLERARAGDPAGLSELLELYRNYLRVLARGQMGPSVRARMEPSDLVQEALLEAHRDFSKFVGASEREFLVWLRRILVRNLLDQARHHTAQARDCRRQQSLDEIIDASNEALGGLLAASGSTPSGLAARREQAVLLADALEELPPDYREVILLRNMQRLPFEAVAERMGRKPGAVRMLWARALERIGRVLGELS